MKLFPLLALIVIVPGGLFGQQKMPGTPVVDLRQLIDEALQNNPEIHAARRKADAAHAKSAQSGLLDNPELTYMREEMPGFRWSQSEMQKIGFMQTVRFPSKLSSESEIAAFNAEHAHHNSREKELEVIAKLKSVYYELWFLQQSIALNKENARLMRQFVAIAKTKFGVGDASLQDVLKANVELSSIENQGSVLHQQEKSAQAMLVALLNRQHGDTLGIVVLSDSVEWRIAIESIERQALRSRPMLMHDSLTVEENRSMLSLAKNEYLPDFRIGVEYVTVPVGDFRGWSVSAGITLPFAPWTIGRAASKVEEASADVDASRATLRASRAMVLSNVRDLYFKAESAKRRFDMYRTAILPQARQSLNASLTAYQNGNTDFLMVIDAYRVFAELSSESLMSRTQFEQTVAELEREVGVKEIVSIERNEQ